jgi:pimeloyl-ACP methyl ester carboxylesterase
LSRLFISYARQDEAVAERLAHAFEAAGHHVWWDRKLSGGSEFTRDIQKAIEDSEQVLVLWSKHGAQSPWVRDEASLARDLGKLVPLTIDGADPPLGFRQFHAINVRDWIAGGDDAIPAGLLSSLSADAEVAQVTRNDQRVSFCRTADGVNLAYSVSGSGPPLVKSANWLNHLDYEWGNPMWRHWIDELSRSNTLVRYDERGNGMSDWNVSNLTFDCFVDDLAMVADAAGFEQFDMVALSQGCPVAIAFAVRYPHRVKRLVLVNGFALGWKKARSKEFVETWDALATLARTGWGKPNHAFRQTFTSLFFPDATAEQAGWWNELQKLSASPENAEMLMRLFGDIDVTDLLAQVRTPTLIMHCRDDLLVPFEAGRMMASRIPGAEFMALDSRNHLPLPSEPAWRRVQEKLRQFLAD